MNPILDTLGDWLGCYLSEPVPGNRSLEPTDPGLLSACLKPGDVVLVEGDSRVSTAIKYLTQSTWSHAALYIGEAYAGWGGDAQGFIEADIREGVRRIGLEAFEGYHCRVCRPVGLNAKELERLIGYAGERLGYRYDLKNIIDLARYLFPTPPVPRRWRRCMLAFGSGDPTRAICSTLIAQAFQSIQYPILPRVVAAQSGCQGNDIQVLYPRHYSHFVPRDFDVSPYFEVIKPTLATQFDHRQLIWGELPARAVDGAALAGRS